MVSSRSVSAAEDGVREFASELTAEIDEEASLLVGNLACAFEKEDWSVDPDDKRAEQEKDHGVCERLIL